MINGNLPEFERLQYVGSNFKDQVFLGGEGKRKQIAGVQLELAIFRDVSLEDRRTRLSRKSFPPVC